MIGCSLLPALIVAAQFLPKITIDTMALANEVMIGETFKVACG